MTLARLHTMSEVIEALSLSRQTIRGLIDSGELPAIKVGQQYRFHPAAVEALLATHAVPVIPTQRLRAVAS